MKGDKFDFYKEVYFFEFARKNGIFNAHSIPMGILSVLVRVIAFYLNDDLFSVSWQYRQLLLAFGVILALAIYKIVRALLSWHVLLRATLMII